MATTDSLFYIALVVMCGLILKNCEARDFCLTDTPKPARRYISTNGTILELTLQVSHRPSHHLTTAVLELYLREILGYEDIKIVQEAQPIDVGTIMSTLSEFVPMVGLKTPVMANLEVPIQPDTDVFYFIKQSRNTIEYFGDLLPPTRYGWYTPESFGNLSLDWRLLTNQKHTKRFSLTDERGYLQSFTRDSASKRFYCEESYCINGTYVPQQCKHNPNQCAVLLSTYAFETGFVVKHIEELNLLTIVMWVGPNLPIIVRSFENKVEAESSSLLFLDWSPSHTLLAKGNYSHIQMPECEQLSSSKEVGCKYEMTRVAKYGWYQLQSLAKPLYYTLNRVNFTLANVRDLAKYYDQTSSNVKEAACLWMRYNTNTWINWYSNPKEKLYLGGIYPLTGSTINAWGIAEGAQMAIEAINKNSSLLQNYELVALRDDGMCRADVVMKRFLDYVLVKQTYDKLVGILGPGCSEALEPLEGMSKHYNTPVITYSAEGTSFSDRERYPYFFRTVGENRQYKYVYEALLKKFGWRRLAVISEDGTRHTEYLSFMETYLAENGTTYVANIKLPTGDKNSSFSLYLDDLKSKRARIIIADVGESIARSLLCLAHQRGMTAKEGYVWFLPAWLPDKWYDTDYNNKYLNETVLCTQEEMIEAIDGYLSVTHAPFAPDDAIMQENITVSEWRQNYEITCLIKSHEIYGNQKGPITDIYSPYAGYAYDAVWAYAYAMNKLLTEYPAAISELRHEKYTKLLVENIAHLNFNGVSGNIQFRGGSTRFSDINVHQWIHNESYIVAVFHPNVSDTTPQIVGGYLETIKDIQWFTKDNTTPDDGTEKCTFQVIVDTLGVDCQQSFVIFNVTIFLILAILLLVSFFYMKKRFERKYKKQIMSIGLNNLVTPEAKSLDKWEIPRERVVINRRLGVGAFGTVYGGHALFDEEKGWTAVAVKTLKVGSNTEEKLDFLSEAEAMKRFDHKNIVKLLAVITKTEPVCTVMEFMLYGDLKNYLLDRRHLVYQRDSEESDEVSCKKLTAMALDVARALSYLADLKYIHRDVACRNCLVNSKRVIKLGDFGMTRMIFDSDYYRFSRKGMLPVRWMAPESLDSGMFSQSSDVWSFGVLLYEIITFGSLPYQGMSNSEVLDFVKKGQTIALPQGIKPQLEGLIKACWTRDYKRRPHASEIAEFLATNPRLLNPCIDVPLDSLDLDTSSQWQMISDPQGKVSINLSDGKPRILQHQISAGGFSMTPNVAYSDSTNITYLSMDDDKKGADSLLDDENTSFI